MRAALCEHTSGTLSWLRITTAGCGGLTGDGVHEVVELPLEDVQRVLQHLLEVGLPQRDEGELLLHRAADGGEHQLRV